MEQGKPTTPQAHVITDLKQAFSAYYDSLSPSVSFDHDMPKYQGLALLHHVDNILTAKPDDFKANAIKAQFLSFSENELKAIPHFKKALAAQPDHLDLQASYAFAAFGATDQQDYKPDYERLVPPLKTLAKLYPADFHVGFMLGYSLRACGQVDEARPYLQDSLKYSQDLSQAFPVQWQELILFNFLETDRETKQPCLRP